MIFMKSYGKQPQVPDSVKENLLQYSPLVQSLLYSRGIETGEDAEVFFKPDYLRDIHDPFLLKDMDKTVDRLITAIEQKEKIVIYSDYDADGIPGGTMLRDFFDKIGFENIENYIPHRHDEGFGLHAEAVETLASAGAQVIITIDCGIVDVVAASVAKKRGVDLIITDHHEPGAELPDAFAIVNPKQIDCEYPHKGLCGSGVAYKLVQAILSKNRFGLKEGHEKWLLDLVGIATLSDMVPLQGENRALAHFGLRVLRQSPRLGLQEMWKKLKLNQKYVTEDDIGFSLSPRINAASRMGQPMDAFKLLSAKTHEEAIVATELLESLNAERKGLVASTVKELKKALRERLELGPLSSVLVLGNPNWKPALLGLVANNILEEVKRPVFLWGRNGDDTIKGSCRSDGSASLIALMDGARESFIQYGGHKMAGGFATTTDAIHSLEEALSGAYEKVKESESGSSTNLYDSELSFADVTWKTFDAVQKFAPFGVGNSKPVFLFANSEIFSTKQFGGDKNHLEVIFNGELDRKVKAIKFFSGPDSFGVALSAGKSVNLLATLEKSTFGRGGPELRLRIVDIIES